MLESILNETASSITMTHMAVCTAVSLGLGFVLAGIHTYRNQSSRNFLMTLVLLPAFILSIIFTVVFCNKLKIEYEYSYADGILTIDRITNGKKRKQCLELDLKHAERICLYGQEDASGSEEAEASVDDYASGRSDARVYILLFKSDGRRHKVIFEPDDKMLSAIKQTVPEIMY